MDMAAWLPCVYTYKPCIDRFGVKSFGRKNSKCQPVFDDVPEGEEGEANEEAKGATYQRVWKLDQVYCAWLIEWVVKREIIQLAELCLTMNYKWYLMVLGQYMTILAGTWSV